MPITDKQSFLDKLHAALVRRGIADADIRPYIERFDRFYDRMVSDQSQVSAESLHDIENIADNIAAQIGERYNEINRLAERTMTVGTVKADEPPPAPLPKTTQAEVPAPAPIPEEEGYELVEENAPTGLVPASDGLEEIFDEEEELEEVPSNRLPDYVEEEPSPNSTMFWVLFAVSLPVTVPLALIGLAVFLAVWAGMIALILASVAALVALTAGGSALSLVGIIYGVIQLFSVVPVGLYEIGMGVIIAGIIMFAGILIYNVAVRLLPFLIRMVWRLFCYVLKRLRVLFNFLRRECAKL